MARFRLLLCDNNNDMRTTLREIVLSLAEYGGAVIVDQGNFIFVDNSLVIYFSLLFQTEYSIKYYASISLELDGLLL